MRGERRRSLGLLRGPLTSFVGLGFRPSGVGLGLVLGDVTLVRRLVLLRPALPLEVVSTGHLTGDLFRLALDVLDDALGTRLRPGFSHVPLLACCVEPPLPNPGPNERCPASTA